LIPRRKKIWLTAKIYSSFPGSAWECKPGGSATSFYAQVAEPPSMHSQAEPAEPGNEIGKIILNIN